MDNGFKFSRLLEGQSGLSGGDACSVAPAVLSALGSIPLCDGHGLPVVAVSASVRGESFTNGASLPLGDATPRGLRQCPRCRGE